MKGCNIGFICYAGFFAGRIKNNSKYGYVIEHSNPNIVTIAVLVYLNI